MKANIGENSGWFFSFAIVYGRKGHQNIIDGALPCLCILGEQWKEKSEYSIADDNKT